jgi:hypothetical protein
MARGRRYYSQDNIERGVTPSELKRLGRKRQKEYMLYWFHGNFEDPSNETPRDEGEFIYIWGGPYDARDELWNEFGSIVPEDRIEEVISEVERTRRLGGPACPNWILKAAVGDWRPKGTKFHVE